MDDGIAEDEAASFLNRGNGDGRHILALEVDGSAVKDPMGDRAPGLRQRKSGLDTSPGGGPGGFMSSLVQGLLRQNIGSQFTFRNMLILTSSATVLFLFLLVFNAQVEGESDGIREKAPHTNSFGGDYNPGIDDNKGNFQRPPMVTDEDLPVSNVGAAVRSMSGLNAENHPGNFRHDPHNSPFASIQYADNVESEERRHQIQQAFDDRMASYRVRYGQWHDPPFDHERDRSYYHDYEYKDVKSFPSNAWQSDKVYMKEFLQQGTALVERVKEAIYEEYGFGMLDLDRSNSGSVAQMKAMRHTYFSIKVSDDVDVKNGAAQDGDDPWVGAAYINKSGWEGLIRKLLHAIMTEDDFYVVAAGPASSTYEGVNFQLTQMMQFNDIMEPVLHQLGVRLISRNMGMDASTTISALGGADIYGEADLFWYRPGADNLESDAQLDFLHKQAILSGERMPVLLTPNPVRLLADTHNLAWVGNIQPGPMACEATDLVGHTDVVLPKMRACDYVACTKKAVKKGKCGGDKKLSCWVDRQTVPPINEDDLKQKNSMARSLQDLNHRQHQLEGRKLTLLLLGALTEALQRMAISVQTDMVPFATRNWHVGEIYGELRERVRRVEKLPTSDSDRPACELLLADLDPEICHMEMHAYTEWTPRVVSDKNLTGIVLGDVIDDRPSTTQLYGWFDLLPLDYIPTEQEVDVHMVTILGEPSRRWLTRSSSREERDNVDAQHSLRRRLPRSLANETDPLWHLHGAPIGFCDGSAQSWCNKVIGNECLLANSNHYKAGLLGYGDSGWLALDIGVVKEGVVLLRFEWSKEYGNGMDLPGDFQFQYSTEGINGAMTTVTGKEFLKKGKSLASDLWVFPVMINKSWSHDATLFGNIELGLRFSTGQGEAFKMLLTHVYYA